MRQLQIRDHQDLHLDDRRHLDVVRRQLMDQSCDMDLMHLVHLPHLDVVQIHLDVEHLFRQDVEQHLDELQNLDEEHLVVVRQDGLLPLVAVVDAELRHLLKMDYYQDVVGEVLLPQSRMDYYQDVVQLVHLEQVALVVLEQLAHLGLRCMQLLQLMMPPLPHVMP
jgi:hypothetical protein